MFLIEKEEMEERPDGQIVRRVILRGYDLVRAVPQCRRDTEGNCCIRGS